MPKNLRSLSGIAGFVGWSIINKIAGAIIINPIIDIMLDASLNKSIPNSETD